MSTHHHRSRRGSSGRRQKPFSAIWLLFSVAIVALLFIYTAQTPEIPDGDPREYPGSPRNIRSRVLPRNAREASNEFHRNYDAPDTTYSGDRSDPVAESRRRYRQQQQRDNDKQQQQPQRQLQNSRQPQRQPNHKAAQKTSESARGSGRK